MREDGPEAVDLPTVLPLLPPLAFAFETAALRGLFPDFEGAVRPLAAMDLRGLGRGGEFPGREPFTGPTGQAAEYR